MAEINMATNAGGPGVRRSKKHSTRVDLTPMVDLGFLLITFFIFTTSMSEPVASRLNMPAEGPNTAASKSGSLTAVLLDDNKIFYYHGFLEEAVQSKSYGTTSFAVSNGFGQVIRQKQSWLNSLQPNGSKDLVLMIKPLEGSAYRDVVGMLDEVMINNVKRYALMDIDPVEKEIIEKLLTEPQPQ